MFELVSSIMSAFEAKYVFAETRMAQSNYNCLIFNHRHLPAVPKGAEANTTQSVKSVNHGGLAHTSNNTSEVESSKSSRQPHSQPLP
jgi:hypothetical protein